MFFKKSWCNWKVYLDTEETIQFCHNKNEPEQVDLSTADDEIIKEPFMRKYKSSDEPAPLPGDEIVEKSKFVKKSNCAEGQVEICAEGQVEKFSSTQITF